MTMNKKSLGFSANEILYVIILFSLVVQVLLVFGDYALLDTDGPEFLRNSGYVYEKLSQLDISGALAVPVFAHWGTILFGTIPYFLKPAIMTQEQASALFFALPAVFNVFLVYHIALRLKLSTETALLAAFLCAFTFSHVMRVRYVVPYSLSMSWFLLGILATLAWQDREKKSCLLAGLCHFFCFFIYYGYWTAAGAGLLFAASYQTSSSRQFFLKTIIAGSAFMLPLCLFMLAGYLCGVNYLDHFIDFSKTITLGSYSEGFSLPFGFFMHAEQLLSAIWLASLVMGLFFFRERPYKYLVSGVLLIYLLLGISSVVLELFVVYPRSLAPMTYLFCLLSASMLLRYINRAGLVIVLSLIAIGFVHNARLVYEATLSNDAKIAYKEFVEETRLIFPADRKLVLQGTCEPYFPECGPPRPTGCHVVKRMDYMRNIDFFQYYTINAAQRKLLEKTRLEQQIWDCPKSHH